MSSPKYWLMKSEALDYSIDDFAKDKRSDWHGVRNYQARNFMRDERKKVILSSFIIPMLILQEVQALEK